jgi:acyl-CoA reductase-like NAD-dependent aldehyde dehydrogenase
LVNLVHGDGQCGSELISDPQVDAVTLTGGAQAGFCAQEICARRHIPLQAELGGNNAALVWADADLEDAANRIAEGAFAMAGQRCTANRRAIVHQDCYDEFLERLQHSVVRLRWGNAAEAATHIGPLVNAKERNRVAELIERAKRDGLRVIVPHQDADEKYGTSDAFYPPTIVCCNNLSHEIVQEETFGPVLVIQKAADWVEAIKVCNGVRQGLVAAIFTRSDELQKRFLNEAQAGVLKINQATADVGIHLPFGGWKASGVGPPEHGITDQEFYTRVQTIYGASVPTLRSAPAS